MAVVGEAQVRITPETKGFEQQLRQDVETPVAKSAKRMGLALAAAFSVQQVGSFFRGTIDAASDAEESVSKIGVVFGTASSDVLAFADTATEAFGLSENAAREATGTYGNLFRSLGLAENQSAEFATTLTGLASDLASFNNVEIDEAITALRSGLVGETEPLKRFGAEPDSGCDPSESFGTRHRRRRRRDHGERESSGSVCAHHRTNRVGSRRFRSYLGRVGEPATHLDRRMGERQNRNRTGPVASRVGVDRRYPVGPDPRRHGVGDSGRTVVGAGGSSAVPSIGVTTQALEALIPAVRSCWM